MVTRFFRELTRLDSRGGLIVGTGDALGSLVGGGFLGVGSQLLLSFVAEVFASVKGLGNGMK